MLINLDSSTADRSAPWFLLHLQKADFLDVLSSIAPQHFKSRTYPEFAKYKDKT